MPTEVSFRELPEVLRRLGDQVDEAGERALRRAAHRGLPEVMRSIASTTPYQPVDQTQYKISWHVAELRGGADLFNTAPHAAVIEVGARPHMPPEGPLIKWAERKLFRSAGIAKTPRASHVKYSEHRKRYVRLRGEELAAAKRAYAQVTLEANAKIVRDLVSALRWHIYHHGQKGKRVLGRAAEKFPRFVRDEIKRVLDELR